MGRPKSANGPRVTVNVGLGIGERDIAALQGHGKSANGVRSMVSRMHAIMRRELPALALEECKAVMGAFKGWPLWADPEISKSMKLGPAMAMEIHDYRECEPGEADQWKPDWAAFEARCATLTDIEVMALAYAAEAAINDHAEPRDIDSLVKRHFKVRG